MKITRHVSAVMAALVVTGMAYSVMATDITKYSDKAENLIGLSLGDQKQTEPAVKHIEDTLTVNVHGKSLMDTGKSKNVTGIYTVFGSQLTIDKDLIVRLKNDAPADKKDLGHYYMSAVYAGLGGKVPHHNDNPDRDYGDSNIHVKGNVDIDAVGVGLQANHRGHIIVDGGGRIITYPLKTSDTYSVVAEEGDVYVNAGTDGKHPGMKDLVAVGNVGLINKDYGENPNLNEAPANIGLAFTTSNSSLTGAVLNEYAESNKNPHNSGADIYLQNGATWNNEWIGKERPTPRKPRPSGDDAAYLYKGSKVRNLVGGANPTAAGMIHPIDARPITIQNYSGFVNANYKTGVPASEAGNGQIIIQHAADHSHITVQGDSAKNLTDDASYRAEMKSLATKLQYTGNDKKLAAAVQVNEGITRPAAMIELGTNAFDAQGNLVVADMATVTHASESSVVNSTKSALVSTAMAWSDTTNDLQRRLGDLRLATTNDGVWAKYIGGESKMTEGTDAHMRYNGVQIGYDHKVSNGWTLGGALHYSTSSNSYGIGNGDSKISGIGLYGTKQHDDGSYLDVIARVNRLSNNYKFYLEEKQQLNGDYHTFGTSFSVEYGKRIKKQHGFYMDPSVELIVGRLNGVSYDANIVNGGSMHVKADAVNSAVGRLGFGIGRETETSNIFAKLALAHEFSSKVNTTYSAPGNPTVHTELDLKDTWLDAEIGGSWSVRPSTYVYGTFTKNFGATIDNTWRIDAGVRHNF
ncbi:MULTISPECIES: autotransporter outer membrane beta-barrel domain-containing protein [unclassified Veillonella]|uniref:autotransporter family protein n=1 Tax=unclassified Veillonella TaxID=2630086 RepID=UPI000F8D7198|nr:MULTISPECIES: autotransporter outer membrane beta-barrel domain-containing protein [unclassified Veillonella]